MSRLYHYHDTQFSPRTYLLFNCCMGLKILILRTYVPTYMYLAFSKRPTRQWVNLALTIYFGSLAAPFLSFMLYCSSVKFAIQNKLQLLNYYCILEAVETFKNYALIPVGLLACFSGRSWRLAALRTPPCLDSTCTSISALDTGWRSHLAAVWKCKFVTLVRSKECLKLKWC